MPTVYEIDRFMSEWAPPSLSESWDNDGVMVCGDKSKQVKKLLVCLELTENALDYAVKEGFDLVVTHHPYIFKKLSRISGTQYANLEKMMKNGISVLSYHTRLDSADGGVNDALAQRLGLENITSFGGETGNIGRMGELENAVTPHDFALLLKEKLGCDTLKYTDSGMPVHKVAVGGGSCGSELYKAAMAGCDTFVTADCAYHQHFDAQFRGMNLIDAGHYHTENPVVAVLAAKVQAAFPEIQVLVSKKHDDCANFFV